MLSELHTRFPAESVALRDGSAVVFRLLTTEDGERLARFYESIPREDLRFYCPHVLDREHGLANAVAADEAGQFVLVVEHENEIAGYAWVRGDGESGGFGMCMRRDFQGRGAGGKLVRRLFEIVDEVGPGVVNLTVQTANQAAVALYTRIGFRVTKKGMRGPKSMFGFPDEPQSWMQRVRSPHEECRGTVRIHCADAGGRLVTKAAELFARELLERTGLVAESADARSADIVLDVDGELLPESYRLAGVTPLRVSGGDGRGVIYGVGRLLRSSQLEPECFRPTEWRGTSVPTNPARAMYFASHFHNFYHVAPIEKVVRYVEDLALYGCNALSVWFDMHHYSGMDDPDAVAMVTRLRRLLEAANGVGMGAALTMLGNEGFTTTPENVKAIDEADNGYFRKPGGFYNTEVCPSKPGGLELILKNRGEVLRAFAGIGFDYIWIWPYDQGGCTCADCTPWGANGFMRTAKPVAELTKQHFPSARIVLSTWYFDRFIENEWTAFHEWVDQEKPDWFDLLLIDGFQAFPEYPLNHGVPGEFPVVGFPEISMDGNGPWGGFGALVRPRHWENYWNRSKALQTGNFPYSEGIYEDAMKFLMLQLNWDPDRAVESILREYGEGMFGEDVADDFVRASYMMEEDEGSHASHPEGGFVCRNDGELPSAEDCAALTDAMEARLSPASASSWRWRVFRLRALIDAELKRTSLKGSSALNDLFRELVDIYHADPARTRSCVMPPWRAE